MSLSPQIKQVLYQFGNGFNDNYYIFNKAELKNISKISLKTNHFESFSQDGFTKINVGTRNKKTKQEMAVDFLVKITDYFDLNYVQQAFNTSEKKLFYSILDKNNNLEFYFQPNCDPTLIPETGNQSVESLGQTTFVKTVSFACPPFIYKCKPNVAYFDKNALSQFIPRYVLLATDDGASYYNSTVVYDQGITTATVLISSLTLDQKLALFVDQLQPDNAIVYTDKIFDLSGLTVDTSQAVLNTTLTSNTPANILLTSFFNGTTANNEAYLIEMGGLSQGQSLRIQNTSNGSDLQITWLNSVASPTAISYNSIKNSWYNTATKAEIDPTFYSFIYPSKRPLFFSPLATQNMTININPESLTLTKNTTGNLTVKIEALQTYHTI